MNFLQIFCLPPPSKKKKDARKDSQGSIDRVVLELVILVMSSKKKDARKDSQGSIDRVVLELVILVMCSWWSVLIIYIYKQRS